MGISEPPSDSALETHTYHSLSTQGPENPLGIGGSRCGRYRPEAADWARAAAPGRDRPRGSVVTEWSRIVSDGPRPGRTRRSAIDQEPWWEALFQDRPAPGRTA